jgi:hypothetical protein
MSAVKIIIFIVIAVLLIGSGVWYNRYLDERAQSSALMVAQ